MAWLPMLIKACYFVAAVLFILGLKRMSSPRTARDGIVWAGVGMVFAVLATFFLDDMHNKELIIAAVVIGVSVAWWTGKRVAMTAMPQMVALYKTGRCCIHRVSPTLHRCAPRVGPSMPCRRCPV